MTVQALGYIGVRAKSLEDWAGYGVNFLGLQRIDKSRQSMAFRMDDRKQRLVVDADGGQGIGFFGWEMADATALAELKKVKGLLDAARSTMLEDEQPGTLIGACELLLEGLYAQRKLSRNEERGGAKYSQAAPERPSKRRDFDDWGGGRLN